MDRHTTIFERPDTGEVWGGNCWVEEYPDAEEVDNEDHMDEELQEEDFPEYAGGPYPYREDHVDDNAVEKAVNDMVSSIFIACPELAEINALYRVGHNDQINTTHRRVDI